MRCSGKLATGQVGLDKDSGKVGSGKANHLDLIIGLSRGTHALGLLVTGMGLQAFPRCDFG
jgi:hypothetical protein